LCIATKKKIIIKIKMAKSDFKAKKASNKSDKQKKEILATNEKLQQKMTNSCGSLKVSRSLAKKPKQVKSNLKKLELGVKKHVEEENKTLKKKK
jgi:hypothetical protein